MAVRYAKLFIAIVTMILATPLSASADKGLPYFVNTDSLAVRGLPSDQTYVLLPGDSRLLEDELQYEFVLPYVHAALATKGFKLAGADQKPALVIFVDYGVGDPTKKTRTTRFPLFGVTGVSGATTTASRIGNYVTATTSFTPTFGVTGYSSSTKEFTTYTKYISIEAYFADSMEGSDRPKPAFRTNITEFGESADLRRAIPPMLASAAPHIGESTAGFLTQGIRENHSVVKKFKEQVKPLP